MKDLLGYMMILKSLYYKIFGKFYERKMVSHNILFSYYDNLKINKETLIMFHGFSSNKEECLPIAYDLSKKYRVIIPDLVGHGETLVLNQEEEFDFSLEKQLEYLYGFIIRNVDKRNKIHIMGHSMGGLIAGCFAAKYPELIKSVNLICPAGITMPNPSPVYSHYINTEENLLSLKTPDDVKNLLHLNHCLYTYLPKFIFQYYSDQYNINGDIYDSIFEEVIINNYSYLDSQLAKIQSKILVLWGDDDLIIDKSCILVLLHNITVEANVFIIREAGHIINTSHSGVCAKYISSHIEKNK